MYVKNILATRSRLNDQGEKKELTKVLYRLREGAEAACVMVNFQGLSVWNIFDQKTGLEGGNSRLTGHCVEAHRRS